jgi:hypothetical protein
VIGATASITAMNQDSSVVTLLVASGSQSELRAMVVNNVVGENQIASGINIRSGATSTGDESTQSNTITQSWGASYDWTFAEGSLLATSVDAATASNSQDATGGAVSGSPKVNCVLSADCGKVITSAENNVGDVIGGDGSTSVGVLPHLPLTISADKIQRVVVNSTGDAIVDVSEMDSSAISVIVDTGSQTNLAALVVNNVGGKNQVASAFNVAANSSVAIGLGSGLPAVVFDSTSPGFAQYGGGQSNTINQFRGTPYQQQ